MFSALILAIKLLTNVVSVAISALAGAAIATVTVTGLLMFVAVKYDPALVAVVPLIVSGPAARGA